MVETIRPMTMDDIGHLEAMDTGIEDDYVIRVYKRVSSGQNRLFGLFHDDQLVSVGGLTVFAKRYAMLGRMRSDRRFRGMDLSTRLMSRVLDEAFQMPDIQWVGANTQENNHPAQRVLQKIGLEPQIVRYGASSPDVSILTDSAPLWKEITDIQSRKHWVSRLYVQPEAVFPYECYYPFPASWDMFDEETMRRWRFFENPQENRLLITKRDYKKHEYLQAVYPYDDIMKQPGLWETINLAHQQLIDRSREEATLVWMDLSKEQAASLPADHPFSLPSPWMLFGKAKR